VAEELNGTESSPVDVARRLHLDGVAGLLFFDSARAPGARFSIITCEPTAVLTERAGRFIELPGEHHVEDPVAWLDANFEGRATGPGLETLPFHGGLAGMLGFEFAWWIDDIHAERKQGPTPVLWVGDYPTALVYSHEDDAWWLTGEGASTTAQVLRDAVERPASPEACKPEACKPEACKPESRSGSNFRLTVSPETYTARVQQAIDAIYAGELFEVNYTERFQADWSADGFALYERLRETSSGAYCGYLDAGSFQLASVSPEQFLSVDDGHLTTRPIKGTRRRGETPQDDARLAEELVTSPKDRAENIMIVDLMRNDLTRVCEPGSVEATEICGLHSFAGVHHLVSTVEGELDDGFSAMDALLASFPAGSITGAPKLRAIELVAELEETARGPYTGSLFYASSHGTLDSSVLIRTAVLCEQTVWYGAGGAVVADSDPVGEYDEACVKARPLQQVVSDE
jgi:para-aminobenzoate synthetase component 1